MLRRKLFFGFGSAVFLSFRLLLFVFLGVYLVVVIYGRYSGACADMDRSIEVGRIVWFLLWVLAEFRIMYVSV